MSTATRKSNADECCISVLIVFIAVLIVIAACATNNRPLHDYSPDKSKDPTFTVESTEVKAYNLTTDDRLFSLINIAVRTRNPITSGSSLVFQGMVVEVERQSTSGPALAQHALRDFVLSQGEDALHHVEAVGLSQVAQSECVWDILAGERRVNVVIRLTAWGADYGNLNRLYVTCKDVMVDFGRSTKMVQKVDCKVPTQVRKGPGLAIKDH